jgi:uncharacterized protein YdhG (YjbR/CyaY superfamily)
MQTDLHNAYIAQFPAQTQTQLQRLRAIIRSVLPDAEETIAYSMPAFRQRVNIVYYAGYGHHIGLYPSSAPIAQFANDLKGFKTSKGAIQFPLDKLLPEKLIKRIVKWRLQEALKKK